MKDVEKLIGGYATGTLSEQEREALFSEALLNQELFDALADEEALRELLADPVARRRLLSTLEHKPVSLLERAAGWFFRPLPMALAAGVAAAGLAVVMIPRLADRGQPEQIAMSRAPEPAGRTPSETDPASPPKEIAEKAPAAPEPQAPPERRAAPSASSGGGPPVSSREEMRPSEPPARARENEQSGGVAGGVVGGVIGGAPRAQQAPAPPPPAPRETAPEPAREPAGARLAKGGAAPAGAASAAAASAAPFEYVLERQISPGGWMGVAPTATLDRKDVVRLAIQGRATGYLQVWMLTGSGSGATQLHNAAILPGMQVHLPVPAQSAGGGDHTVMIVYTRDARQAGGQAQGFRQLPQIQKGRNEAVRDELADAGEAGGYTVNIPLRFR